MTEKQKARVAAALLGSPVLGDGVVECSGCGQWAHERDAVFLPDGRWWRCPDCTPFMSRQLPGWTMALALAVLAALILLME